MGVLSDFLLEEGLELAAELAEHVLTRSQRPAEEENKREENVLEAQSAEIATTKLFMTEPGALP